MNKEQILAMKPGRELDALVAEKVMGWTIVTESNPRHYVLTDNLHYMTGKQEATWHPSTSISAAWEVFQNMKGRLFSRRNMFLKHLQDVVSFGAKGLKEGQVVAYPDVIWFLTPETICKAALLALGERGEKAE